MSFLRPEAVGLLHRWGETAAAAAVVLVAGWYGLSWTGQGVVFGWFALGGAALALFWLRAALLGVLAERPVTGPGLVVLREGEIGYMGQYRGGFLEIDTLVRIEIYRVEGGTGPVWRLVAEDGQGLAIPAAAEGAEHLPEALSALPGFSDLAAVGLLKREAPGRHLLWERPTPSLPRRLPRLLH